MNTEFYTIQVFGRATWGRNRTAKPVVMNIAEVPIDTCVVISDDIVAKAKEAAKGKGIRSGCLAIGAFKTSERDGMVFVNLLASQQRSLTI